MSDIIESIPETWKNRIIFLLVGVVVGTGGGYFRPGKFTDSQGEQLAVLIKGNAAELAIINKKIPNHHPPLEYQIQTTTWRNGIEARLNSISSDDRHTQDQVKKLERNCTNHMDESVDWKQLIKKNEQSIDNLWKWYQRRTE